MPAYRLFINNWDAVTANVQWLWFGMIIGLATVPIIKELSTTGSIFKGFVKEPAADVDPERPLSY